MAKPFSGCDGNAANIKIILTDKDGNDILDSKLVE
jgi:hypothetical protein